MTNRNDDHDHDHDDPDAGFKVKIKGSNSYLAPGGQPVGVTCSWKGSEGTAAVISSWGNIHLDTSTGDQKKVFISMETTDANWTREGDLMSYNDNGTTLYLGPEDQYGEVHLTTRERAVAIAIEAAAIHFRPTGHSNHETSNGPKSPTTTRRSS